MDSTALDVATNRSVTATFDLAMNGPSVVDHFSINPSVPMVPVTFDSLANKIILAPTALPPASGLGPQTPDAFLNPNTLYTVTISAGAEDEDGNPLLEDYVWTFKTGLDINELPVALGLTSSFVLIGNAITGTAPPTFLTGDLGSIGALTGFTDIPSQVTGITYSPSSESLVPIGVTNDLDIVFVDARDRAYAPVTPLTLVLIAAGPLKPGIYKSTPAFTIPTDVILDAGNDGDATFIFQITGAFGIAAGNKIILQNGAKASNVFWQTTGAVNLAANTTLNGTLVTAGAVTMGANAVIEAGRLMTKTGAVTLGAENIFTIPGLMP